MKLTIREMVLLAVLGVFAIGYACYNFVFEPQMAQIGQLRDRLASLETLHQEILYYTDPNGSFQEQLQNEEEAIKAITQKYFPELILERMMLLPDQLYASAGMQSPGSYSFPEPAAERVFSRGHGEVSSLTFPMLELVRQITGETVVSAPPPSQVESPEIYHMTMTLPFQGSYNQALSLLRTIEEYEREILVSSFSVSGSSWAASGSMTVHFIGIPKPFVQDEEFLTWDRTGPYTRTSPFGP